mmetsp:Transcript_67793/g.161794  ORF Transcript_67793/g.161794 Transcript_67793/m.161794 type:complete len:263 (+) Transcript_67793:1008-1796(+)
MSQRVLRPPRRQQPPAAARFPREVSGRHEVKVLAGVAWQLRQGRVHQPHTQVQGLLLRRDGHLREALPVHLVSELLQDILLEKGQLRLHLLAARADGFHVLRVRHVRWARALGHEAGVVLQGLHLEVDQLGEHLGPVQLVHLLQGFGQLRVLFLQSLAFLGRIPVRRLRGHRHVLAFNLLQLLLQCFEAGQELFQHLAAFALAELLQNLLRASLLQLQVLRVTPGARTESGANLGLAGRRLGVLLRLGLRWNALEHARSHRG